MEYDTIVVGAGIIGLSTACELARRGRSVVAIDRFGTGHPVTSSTGASRSIRVAYGEPFYVSLALEAIEAWGRLEAETGHTILHLTGQIDLGPEATLEALQRTVREGGLPIQELGPPDLRRLFPELVLAPGEAALFHPQAGTVLADAGLQALLQAGREAGITYVAPERVTRIELGETVEVTTERQRFRAKDVIVAAGPWAKDLLDGIGVVLPLAPSIAQVTFLDAPLLVDRPGIAAWGETDQCGVYGHPVPGIGYKIAFDAGASGWQPDVEEWEPDPDEERRLLDWLTRRMPSVPHRVSRTQRHPWTMTPDADFIVDRKGPLIVACGCSGHAFKFGPALGRFVADIADGAPVPELTRIDRPALRAAAPSPASPIIR